MNRYDDSVKPFDENEILKRVKDDYKVHRCPNCGMDIKIPNSVIATSTEDKLRYELDYINYEIDKINKIINNSDIPIYLRKELITEIGKMKKRIRLKVVKGSKE